MQNVPFYQLTAFDLQQIKEALTWYYQPKSPHEKEIKNLLEMLGRADAIYLVMDE